MPPSSAASQTQRGQPDASTCGAAPPPVRRRSRRWALIRWGIILAVWSTVALALLVLWFARDLPRPADALAVERRPGLTLLDRSGHQFAAYGDVVGDSLRLSEMPKYLPEAVVAVEDRSFWTNPGIDPLGILRAAWVDLRARRIVEGGSTLTQQVAKNLFLSDARTLRRKVQELLLSLWLDHSFTKQEILEIWLNRVYLGSGAWGMDAGARTYFGISARHVSLWQAAVLAGIPQGPSVLNPRADPVAAAARARQVLQAMVDMRDITEAQAKAAAAQIHFTPPPTAAGWFADWSAEQAQPMVPEGADAVLHTTLDARLQTMVESRLDAMLAGPGVAAHATQGAVVVLDAATGAVRAMAGGRNYGASPYNRAVLARRQPGSSFKPFVWLAALQNGVRPDDMVMDAPIRIGGWSPKDFDRSYLGPITVETALAQSINTAAVRLLIAAGGAPAVAEVAHRLGIADKLPDSPSLALGTGEVGLLEMAGAYATFFNGGYRVTPTGIESIEADHRLITPDLARPRVIDPDLAAMMVRMMAAVVREGTGRAAALPGRLVAGKTGTTEDYRDAWFIGWTNGTIVAVWFGNDNDAPMRDVSGGGLPAQLFHQIAAGLP
jgi:penicillin-binding protein 1A